MRLDKFLSESTPFSRKEIKQLIKAGAVEVNGEKAQRPEQKTSDEDVVSVTERQYHTASLYIFCWTSHQDM